MDTDPVNLEDSARVDASRQSDPLDALAQEPVAARTNPLSPRSMNILLVEDHEDTLRAMSRLLRKLEYRVTTANCVSKALKAAADETFDLLISDLGLPDGTGLELMAELVSKRPLKGIALTGFGMETDIAQTRAAGFQKHLTKPINFRELQTAIEQIT
jgi:CheY-like chemotaxis protein